MKIYQNLLLKYWIEVYDKSEANYKVDKEIRIKTSKLRSDLCDFSDADIIIKEITTVVRANNANRSKSVTFKHNAPFINCISKFIGVKIDNQKIYML